MSFCALKTIALLSMLWDHISAVWPVSMLLGDLLFPSALETTSGSMLVQHITAYIGRIAAPIFLFSIANGYRHTRNFKRYALRLLIFACLSEYPYRLLFEESGNIMFTLLAGLLTLRLFDWGNSKKQRAGYLMAAPVIIAAQCLHLFEGNGFYILFILIFYLSDSWSIWKKAILWPFLLIISRYRLGFLLLSGDFPFRLWALNALGPYLGVILTLFYNGKKGASFPGFKYLWYCFYPTHLLLLWFFSR